MAHGRPLLLAAILAGLLSSGCGIPQWTADRFLDAADPVRFGAGVGLGADLSLEAGQAFHLGFGVANSTRWGWRQRTLGKWAESEFGFLFYTAHARGRFPKGFAGEEILGPADGSSESDITMFLLPAFTSVRDESAFVPKGVREGIPPVRWLDLELSLVLAIPSFRIGISPGELVDFAAGFFFIDLSEDDGRLPGAPGARARWVRDLSARDLRFRERALRRLEAATGKKAPLPPGADPVEAIPFFQKEAAP